MQKRVWMIKWLQSLSNSQLIDFLCFVLLFVYFWGELFLFLFLFFCLFFVLFFFIFYVWFPNIFSSWTAHFPELCATLMSILTLPMDISSNRSMLAQLNTKNIYIFHQNDFDLHDGDTVIICLQVRWRLSLPSEEWRSSRLHNLYVSWSTI